MLSFFLTIPPILALLYGLTRCSFFERPRSKLWLAASLGALATLPAGAVNDFGDATLQTDQPWFDVLIRCFLVVGPNEELWKLLALLLMIRCYNLYRTPLTLIACALAIGLGFAGIENWWMVATGYASASLRIIILPTHSLLTGCAAIFLCFAVLREGLRWRYRILAILAPSLIHGAINIAPLALERDLFMPLSIIPSIGMISVLTTVFFVLIAKWQRFVSLDLFGHLDRRAIANVGFGAFTLLASLWTLGALLPGSYDAFLNSGQVDEHTISLRLHPYIIDFNAGSLSALLALGLVNIELLVLAGLSFFLLRRGLRRLVVSPKELIQKVSILA